MSSPVRPRTSVDEPPLASEPLTPWDVNTDVKTIRRPGSSPVALPATAQQATPTTVVHAERSEPIRVISMKQVAADRESTAPRAPLHVQLRSMAEIAGVHSPNKQLGRLAPPRDPRQVRARRRRADLAWAGLAIVLAAAISLAIWLLAGR